MLPVGALAFGQKIVGDRDKLLPECESPARLVYTYSHYVAPE